MGKIEMSKYPFTVVVLISCFSYAETYDQDSYCETDIYQELNKCLMHNLDLAQKKIDKLSSIYIEELQNDGLDGFEEANSKWQEYANSVCSLHSKSAGSGSIKSIRSMSCQLHVKERRVNELGCLISYHLGDGNDYQKYCNKYLDTRSKI